MCRLNIVALLFCLLAWASSAHADSVLTTCQQLVEQKAAIQKEKSIGEHVSAIKLAYKLIFDRQSLIKTNEVKRLENSVLDQSDLSIFTLGKNTPFTSEDKSKINKISSMQKISFQRIRILLKANTPEECVAIASSIQWTPDELTHLQEEKNAALESYRHQETQESIKVAKKAIKSHPTWKLVEVNNWGEILQEVRVNSTSKMIIMAHSDPNGRLFDSSRGEFPSSFFSSLPPSVQFVGIYSCESNKVASAYGLNQLSNMEVVTVSLGAPFNVTATTPIILFSVWTHELIKDSLLHSEHLDKNNSISDEEKCTIRFNDLHLVKGDLAISIDGKAIGVLTGDHTNEEQLVSCSYLTNTPTIFIEPTHASFSLDQSVVELLDSNFTVSINHHHNFQTLTNVKIFNRDGFFRSAIIKF